MERTEQLLRECIGYIMQLESGRDKSFWINCLEFTDEDLKYYDITFEEEGE